jgi:hypothetical protein
VGLAAYTKQHNKTAGDIITQLSKNPHQFLFTPNTHNCKPVTNGRTHQTIQQQHQLISHNSVPIFTNFCSIQPHTTVQLSLLAGHTKQRNKNSS